MQWKHSGLADLNQSRFKSVDFFVKKIEWFKSYWWFHLPMKNYNKQKQMYCFILLFNLFNSLTTDFVVTGSASLILCNMQLTMLERFSWLCIDVLQHKINWKPRKYELKNKKSDLNFKQESPAVADKPARRLRKVCTVYVRAVGL